jgi:hypothetical protein
MSIPKNAKIHRLKKYGYFYPYIGILGGYVALDIQWGFLYSFSPKKQVLINSTEEFANILSGKTGLSVTMGTHEYH